MDQPAGSKKSNLKLPDEDRARLGVWMRLWIVGSVLWSLVVMMSTNGFGLWGIGEPDFIFDVVFWLGPCLFVLALGWTLGWAFRPFTKKLKLHLDGKESGQPGGQIRGSGSAMGALVSIVRRLFFLW